MVKWCAIGRMSEKWQAEEQANEVCELQYSGYADAVIGLNETYCLNGWRCLKILFYGLLLYFSDVLGRLIDCIRKLEKLGRMLLLADGGRV